MSFATWNFAELFLKWRKWYLLGKEEGGAGEEETPFVIPPIIKVDSGPLQNLKIKGVVLAGIVLLALAGRE